RVLEDALAEEVQKLGLRRPLVVTDPAGEGEDLFDRVCDALPAGCAPQPLRAIAALPDAATLEAGAAAFAQAGCDGVLGLGGPAALDMARALGLAGPLARARDAGPVPVIAIPTTTAGVGLGPCPLRAGPLPPPVPALILCDPTLTTTADAARTAAAGMDALTHCIEAYLGTTWNPPADGMAIDGARRAGAHLERAVRDGQDIDARREMLAAALNAGLAAQKGLGGVHALAHALEAEVGLVTCHGMLHAALLPPVLAFNAPAVADRFGLLREALRLPPGLDLTESLVRLGARIGLPARLDPLRLDRSALRRIARRAAEDPANRTNPRLATADDYLHMLEQAL
ncbi:MAG TPA: iron-containing alcohol dehydrogenase, partial [Paracoccaceae bacterium]|nr:iron-containing alcohol dehydrogenase [Paracoccaceae bacterium]